MSETTNESTEARDDNLPKVSSVDANLNDAQARDAAPEEPKTYEDHLASAVETTGDTVEHAPDAERVIDAADGPDRLVVPQTGPDHVARDQNYALNHAADPAHEDAVARAKAATVPATSDHVDAQVKTHVVLIPKDYTTEKTVRFMSGTFVHNIPVGEETEVGEAIFEAVRDSDVPHSVRPI